MSVVLGAMFVLTSAAKTESLKRMHSILCVPNSRGSYVLSEFVRQQHHKHTHQLQGIQFPRSQCPIMGLILGKV